MSTDRRRTLSILAIAFGVLAVLIGAASFATSAAWELRGVALVLIIIGLGLGRMAGRQPPAPDRS
jgi:hypothetical protein